MSKKKEEENGLEVEFTWKSVQSLGDFIKTCEYLDRNPCGCAFEVRVRGKDEVIRE